MSATEAITLDWLSSEASKLQAYNISAVALSLINKSETLKADIRAYAKNTLVDSGKVNSKAAALEYNVYIYAIATSVATKGFLNIAVDSPSLRSFE